MVSCPVSIYYDRGRTRTGALFCNTRVERSLGRANGTSIRLLFTKVGIDHKKDVQICEPATEGESERAGQKSGVHECCSRISKTRAETRWRTHRRDTTAG